jgi:hypothetical protein
MRKKTMDKCFQNCEIVVVLEQELIIKAKKCAKNEMLLDFSKVKSIYPQYASTLSTPFKLL